jgi:hypothetical protein
MIPQFLSGREEKMLGRGGIRAGRQKERKVGRKCRGRQREEGNAERREEIRGIRGRSRNLC